MAFEIRVFGRIWIPVSNLVAVAWDIEPVGCLVGEVFVDYRKGDQHPLSVNLDHGTGGKGGGRYLSNTAKNEHAHQEKQGKDSQHLEGIETSFEMLFGLAVIVVPLVLLVVVGIVWMSDVG
jgi:hypothetical protein